MVKKTLMKPINIKDLIAKLGHIVVLKGGISSEREISLSSGAAVYAGLQRLGFHVSEIDVNHDVIERLQKLKPDFAFITLHGENGEDGVIQGLLETMEINYTGSDVLSSALAMNKVVSKQIWLELGLRTPEYELLTDHSDWEFVIKRLEKVVVKPVSGGSSLGISMTNNPNELKSYYSKALFLAQRFLQSDVLKESSFQQGSLVMKFFLHYN